MIFKDYYRILELETNRVSIDEIKQTYRELAKKYHPDVNISNKFSEERFKDINEAYRVLSNSSSKRKYDRMWNNYVGNKKKKEFEESKIIKLKKKRKKNLKKVKEVRILQLAIFLICSLET